MLQQSLAGWEALETDLLEAANLDQQAAQLGERVRSATQVVVDAILDLLDVGVFRLVAASECGHNCNCQQTMQACGQLGFPISEMKAGSYSGVLKCHFCIMHEIVRAHKSSVILLVSRGLHLWQAE